MISDYKKLKVYITGASGFKGSWLLFWLKKIGAKTKAIGLEPEKNNILLKSLELNNSSIEILNILDYSNLFDSINNFKPDIIFHLAAQSIVSESIIDPITTYKTNVIGSANILEVSKKLKIPMVMITSDKCYKNNEWLWSYRENDELGGNDPYSASKAAAELVFNSYLKTFYLNDKYLYIASARAGNVIGGGDMKTNRIIPDIFRSIFDKNSIYLRNPKSTRPWQHVLEPLNGYMILGLNLLNKKFLTSKIKANWNFGPNTENCKDVEYLTNYIINYLKIDIPIKVKKTDFKEQNLLMLDNTKSKSELNWNAKMGINQTLEFTSDWYMTFKKTDNILKFSNIQIEEFENL